MNNQPLQPALSKELQRKVNQLLQEYSPQASSAAVAQQTQAQTVATVGGQQYHQLSMFEMLPGVQTQ